MVGLRCRLSHPTVSTIALPVDRLARRVAQCPGLVLRGRFGNRPDDRLGVAAADQQPAAGPVEPQAVQPVGLRRRRSALPGRPVPRGCFSGGSAIFVFTIS